MIEGEKRPGKQDVANALLARGSMFVYLDPRREEVSVPPWFGKQAQLVLQFGLQLPVPIPDMRVDEEGVFGTLSFNRQPFGCRIPWSGVFALVGDDGMGMVWEEDLPEEIAAEVEAGFGKTQPKRPVLRAISGGRASDDPPAETEASVDAAPSDRASSNGSAAAMKSPDSAPPLKSAPALKSVPPPPHASDEPPAELAAARSSSEATSADRDDKSERGTGDDEKPRRPSAPHLRLIK